MRRTLAPVPPHAMPQAPLQQPLVRPLGLLANEQPAGLPFPLPLGRLLARRRVLLLLEGEALPVGH
jgi:hypothetical protein